MAERFRAARAAFWATTWAVGVAIGVAAGGWLTVVGGAAAPGVESLDYTEDLIVLPLVAAGVTFVVHFLGQSVVFAFRSASRKRHDSDEGRQRAEDDSIDG